MISKNEQPVTIPEKLTKIERLSHFTEMGAYWVVADDADVRIGRAAEYNKKSVAEIEKLLLSGFEVECSHTSFESIPDIIRDGAICAALQKNREIIQSKFNQAFAKKHTYHRCRSCGATGYSGSYPFSTAPSTGLCDDCL